jgi:hypothetical protein
LAGADALVAGVAGVVETAGVVVPGDAVEGALAVAVGVLEEGTTGFDRGTMTVVAVPVSLRRGTGGAEYPTEAFGVVED